MKLVLLAKSILLLTLTLCGTLLFTLVFRPYVSFRRPDSMARSFILWLHGRGDSGPANEPIKNIFTSPEFRNTDWSFPSAPVNPVTCNYGAMMPSWFDIHEIPIKADSPKDESSLVKAVQNVHKMIDKEIDAGTNPNNIFVCGFSQGGALTLASVLLYPKTLAGGAVFSGWVPFNSSLIDQISPDAKRVLLRIILTCLVLVCKFSFFPCHFPEKVVRKCTCGMAHLHFASAVIHSMKSSDVKHAN